MPHLRLEYTDDLAPRYPLVEYFQHCHRILADAGIRLGNCKSRASRLTAYLVGDGSPGSFAHLDVSFLEGRPPETHRSIGASLLDLLRDLFPDPTGSAGTQLTVEIREIPRAGYFKHPGGTLS